MNDFTNNRNASHQQPQELSRYAYITADEIITTPPNTLLRSGITIIFLGTMLVIAMSWFIKYPDSEVLPFEVTSDYAPLDFTIKLNGSVGRKYFSNNDTICAGDTIAYIHNAALLPHVQEWHSFLNRTVDLNSPNYPHPPQGLRLGSLQNSYRELSELITAHELLLSTDMLNFQIDELQLERLLLQEIVGLEQLQVNNYEVEQSIEERLLQRIADLHDNKLASQEDLDNAQLKMIKAQRSLASTAISMQKNKFRIEQIQSDIAALRVVRNHELRTARLDIINATRLAIAELDIWAEQYLIISPTCGIIFYPENTKLGTYLIAGSTLSTRQQIRDSSDFYALAHMPQVRIGKYKPGMKALLRFDAWPHKEHGSIVSEVLDVANLPTADNSDHSYYEIKLSVPLPATTSFGQNISVNYRSTGSAKLIGSDQRLLERLFTSIRHIISSAET